MTTTGRGRIPAVLLFLIVGVVCSATPARTSGKTDVVTLENGDRIVGEIKELDRGRLKYSTDYLGTIFIEWNHVVKVVSKQQLQFENEEGERAFGSLEEPTEPGTLRVVAAGLSFDLEIDTVVRMTPIEETIAGRMDGNVNLGFSYTKGSEVAQLTFDGSAKYQTRKFLARTSLQTITTVQEEDTTNRADLLFSYTRFRKERRLVTGNLVFQSNDELGIDLRVLLSATYGKYLFQTNNSFLLVSGGLAVNRERVTGDDPSQTSLEGVFNLMHSFYRYDDPETDFTTSLNAFPSLTESGRVRLEVNTSLTREIVNDFNIKLTGYFSFDNGTEEDEEASDSDWGIVLSLGWSF